MRGLSSQETLEGVQEQLEEEQSPQPKRKSKKMSAMQAGSLAIVISKETWTRQRKYDIQREDSPLCLVCQGTDEEAADTIIHRKFECQGIENLKGIKILSGFVILFKGTCRDRAGKGGNYGSTQGSDILLGVPNPGWTQDIKLRWCRVWGCRIRGILMVPHMRVSGRIWLGQGGLWC